MKSYLKSEVEKSVKLGEIECFTADQIRNFTTESYNEINKSIDNDSKERQINEVALEVRSFSPIEVTDDVTLMKSILFIREAQIAWNEPVGDDIQKSRTGRYLNTELNRKLGRVGKEYGEDNIEKGNKAVVGEVRTWGDKKYKKQPNGKWVEVSEHGKTKREHEAHHDKLREGAAKFNDSKSQFFKDHIKEANESLESSKKLSDKEYDEEELNKAYESDIEKGKKANIGEIREYGGVKYRKVSSTGNPNKDWQKVQEGGKSSDIEWSKDDGVYSAKIGNTEFEIMRTHVDGEFVLTANEKGVVKGSLAVCKGAAKDYLDGKIGKKKEDITVENQKDELDREAKDEERMENMANKFLDTIRISNNTIELKDVKVYRTPKNNLAVLWKGREILTVDGKLLDEKTIKHFNLEEKDEDDVSKKEQEIIDFSGNVGKLRTEFSALKNSAIIKAATSYVHTKDTLEQFDNRIDILSKLRDTYEEKFKNMDKYAGENSYTKYRELRDEQQNIDNALIANKMARSISSILQEYKADPGIGLTDIYDQKGLFSDVRSIIYRAQGYEKKIFK